MGDRQLMAALERDCDVIGVANGFNWTRLQYRPDMALDFTQAEQVFGWASAHGKRTRGHNIIWHDDNLPQWLRQRIPTLSASDTADVLVGHVRETFAHWRGRLIQQDVVNEPIDSAGLQPTLWNSKLGERYIDLAFHAAEDIDPTTLRVLNQDWIEMDSREHAGRRRQLLGLLERLLARGVPVQALGIEGHLQAEYPFSERAWRDFLDEVVGMGLKLVISEYDVHDRGIAGGVAARDAAAAALLRAFLDVTLDYRQCLGLLSQSWSDRYDWLSVTPAKARKDRQELRPNPLDRNYRPKPIYSALAAALRAAPAR